MTAEYLGGQIKLSEDLTISRMGYGAMQLTGPNAFDEPKNRDEAISVLQEVVRLGINHIDTSDFYGPHITNKIIKEALSPYTNKLHIVTKVGAVRGDDGSWIPSLTKESLIDQVHDNLRNLGVEVLDVVNLRVGPPESPAEGTLAEPFTVLADLQKQGLIRHLGVSNVTPTQLSEAQSIARVVTVQNNYNLANRGDDELVDRCATEGVTFMPFFPLGGFTPLQSVALSEVAANRGVSKQQVALAWLLQRSPTLALIPGTSSVAHLHDNIAAVNLELTSEELEKLNAIGDSH